MAIPIRITLTCPACGASEAKTIGDMSVGPKGRNDSPQRYALFGGEAWAVSGLTADDTISCKACGARDFTTLGALADQ